MFSPWGIFSLLYTEQFEGLARLFSSTEILKIGSDSEGMKEEVNISLKTSFPPVTYARFPVEKLSPEEIDELLAVGWFRNDLNVYTTVTRFVEGEWKSCLMLRIPLKSLVWKKRLRKLLRRNAREFDVSIKPFVPRPVVEKIWQDFKTKVHNWGHVPRIGQHLFKGRLPANFNTWEVGVYHKNRLVAFSIFDRGATSLASLEAAYHPDFQRFSLGLYTMLLEIEFGKTQNMNWYYPGFYPKDTSMFDYKFRTGNVEFFRLKNQCWLPWEEAAPSDWLYDEMKSKLEAVQAILMGRQIKVSFRKTIHTNIPSEESEASDHNVFLELLTHQTGGHVHRTRVVWDVLKRHYEVYSLVKVLNEEKGNVQQTLVFPLSEYRRIGCAEDAGAAVDLLPI